MQLDHGPRSLILQRRDPPWRVEFVHIRDPPLAVGAIAEAPGVSEVVGGVCDNRSSIDVKRLTATKVEHHSDQRSAVHRMSVQLTSYIGRKRDADELHQG